MKKSFIIIALIVLADQILKIWVKLNMRIGETINLIGDRINLYFIENNGMAFGMQFAGEAGKFALTLIRLIAVAALSWFLIKTYKKTPYKGLLWCFSLIIAGAIGNIIDSVFYGVIFSESTRFSTAVLFPENGGYSSLFHGKVVDMFYCPIIQTHLPDWVPGIGGNYIEFFRPIFNIADSAITIGVFWLFFGYNKWFAHLNKKEKANPEDEKDKEEKITINY